MVHRTHKPKATVYRVTENRVNPGDGLVSIVSVLFYIMIKTTSFMKFTRKQMLKNP